MPDTRAAAAAANQSMRAEVQAGLDRDQKELSPKFFYDERGSRLFEQITGLVEYYPTRTERHLLRTLIPKWIPEFRTAGLLELGAGSAEKSRVILDAMRDAGTLSMYVPVDVSAEFLAETARRLRAEYPALRVTPLVADITARLDVPAHLHRPALFAFLGSTIGNFEDGPAVDLLQRVARQLQPGDRFLLGADLVKDLAPLEAAYNDRSGVTAEFNLNMLRVLNRELGSNFDPSGFTHRAFFNARASRIEMHLVSLRSQQVNLPGVGTYLFQPGETIRTEISRKFTRESLSDLLAAAGMRIERWETDERGWYAMAVAVLAAPGPSRRPWVSGLASSVAPLREDLRRHAFRLEDAPAESPGLIGAEVEFLALRAEDGRPCPVEARSGVSSMAFLRAYGAGLGWTEERSPKGAPRFRLGDAGALAFEPGGQWEISTDPSRSVSDLVSRLQAVVTPLRRAAEDAGIRLLACGIDPVNPVEHAPLMLQVERYVRMAEYFAAIGRPAGARMMRQTAALHVNLDFGTRNMVRWRVLNAAAPYLTAMFANSSRYAGAETGSASTRAQVWRALDPARTGILSAGPVSEDEYLDFALGAPAILLDTRDGRHRPFGEIWAAGQASMEAWHEHLTTLFPDIRPRGYLEVRCIDALPPEWYAVPLTVLAGMLYDPESLAEASDLLGSPDPTLLSRAGAAGMADPELGPRARALFELGLAGARRLGRDVVAARELETAAAYYQRYTAALRSPAGD